MSLVRTALSSARWNYSFLAMGLVAQLVYTAIASRLLRPDEFAAFALMVTLVNVLSFFGVAALGNWVLRSTPADWDAARGAVKICLFLGLWFAGVILLAAPAFTRVWPLPGIAEQARILAVWPLVWGLSAIGLAALRREGRYRRAAVLELLSLLTGISVSLTLLQMGVGASSLAIGQVVGVLASVTHLAIAVPQLVRLRRSNSIRDAVSFAVQVGWFGLAQYAMNNAPLWLTGRALGAEATGSFARAFSLVGIPLTQFSQGLTRSVYPLYRTAASNEDRLGRAVSDVITIATLAAGMIGGIGFAFAEPVSLLLLGPEWAGVGSLVAILFVSESLDAVSAQVGVVAESLRHISVLWWSLAVTFVLLSTVLVSILIMGGSVHDLVVALVVVRVGTLTTRLFALSRRVKMDVRSLGRAVAIHVVLGAIIAFAVSGVASFGWSAIAELAAQVGVAFAGLLLLTRCNFVPGIAVVRRRRLLGKFV